MKNNNTPNLDLKSTKSPLYSRSVPEFMKDSQDLDEGWSRTTIILEDEPYDKLETISNIKGLFVKDIVNDLIKIYNSVAITDKDNQNIEKEKKKLKEEIINLVKVQDSKKVEKEEKESDKPMEEKWKIKICKLFGLTIKQEREVKVFYKDGKPTDLIPSKKVKYNLVFIK